MDKSRRLNSDAGCMDAAGVAHVRQVALRDYVQLVTVVRISGGDGPMDQGLDWSWKSQLCSAEEVARSSVMRPCCWHPRLSLLPFRIVLPFFIHLATVIGELQRSRGPHHPLSFISVYLRWGARPERNLISRRWPTEERMILGQS